MLQDEFYKRTGIDPTADEYKEIEEAYYNYPGDKDSFCKEWIKDGGPEKLIRNRAKKITELEMELAEQKKVLEEKNSKLAKDLEQEQEWKLYEDTANVLQSDYEKLIGDCNTHFMSEDEAKQLLYDWYGFAKDKITIISEVPSYEINRHRQLRKIGTIDRRPAYNATDWNYIRFDCGCMSYELDNDNLRFFEL